MKWGDICWWKLWYSSCRVYVFLLFTVRDNPLSVQGLARVIWRSVPSRQKFHNRAFVPQALFVPQSDWTLSFVFTVIKVQWLKPLFSSVCRTLRFLFVLYYYLYGSFSSLILSPYSDYRCALLTTCTVLLSLSSIILFLSAFPEVPRIINRLYYVLYY